ncbi:hypothetical protein BSIN_5138 [Burkholderia singularis]|uniref:Uncharacterized protein n=1 Tax=Burkholderia singularis TaxID=1503053 RepID=A0A238HBF3_9BURK|nr:hypothetical protein BSIN_5138 [Burkholderia singularis]
MNRDERRYPPRLGDVLSGSAASGAAALDDDVAGGGGPCVARL